jgi:hypothetical protein
LHRIAQIRATHQARAGGATSAAAAVLGCHARPPPFHPWIPITCPEMIKTSLWDVDRLVLRSQAGAGSGVAGRRRARHGGSAMALSMAAHHAKFERWRSVQPCEGRSACSHATGRGKGAWLQEHQAQRNKPGRPRPEQSAVGTSSMQHLVCEFLSGRVLSPRQLSRRLYRGVASSHHCGSTVRVVADSKQCRPRQDARIRINWVGA